MAVRDALRTLGSKEILVHGDKIITAAKLLDKMEAYAAAIRSHGVKAGERIWCKLVNGIETFAALYGAIFAGAVAVLVDDDLTKHEAYHLSKDDMAEYFLTDGTYAEKFKGSRQNFKKCFVVGGDFPGFHSLTDSQATYGESLEDVYRKGSVEDWPAALCFSSGTTGSPKAILITHYSFVASLTSSMSSHLLQRGDKCVIIESMTHAFGFLFTMYAACVGATIVFMPPTTDHDELLDKIDMYQVQVVCCFPAILSRISRMLEETGRQMKSVRKVVFTAASIPRKLGERVLRHLNLTDFKNFLGCSEGLSPYCVPPPGETFFESVGFPASNVRLKGSRTRGEHGEIWVQTPSASPGYVSQDGQLLRVVDDNGWLHTAVIEACVVGIPDEEVTEAPTAFVVRRKNDRGEPLVTEEELVDLVASQTAYYKHLYGGVVFLDGLPRTASGKTNVKKLRSWRPSTRDVETCKAHDYNIK
ncbi:hypothetical protein MTO96_052162 [Rhipicephalus appendiculatus]